MTRPARKPRAPRPEESPRQIAITAIEASIGIAAFRGWSRAALRRELRRKREWFLSWCSGGTPLGRGISERALSAVWYRAVRHVAGQGVRALTRAEQLHLFDTTDPRTVEAWNPKA